MPLQTEISFNAVAPLRPWVGRKFGVEMEVRAVTARGGRAYDQGALVSTLQAARLVHPVNRMGYAHSNGSSWDVKTDASCGYEIASPALLMTAEGHNADLRKAADALKDFGPRVDRACGLHVHVDCSDFSWQDLQALIVLWARYEPFFFSYFPPSRRNNRYCSAIRFSEWNQPESAYWQRQYKAALDARTERDFRASAGSFPRGALNITGWWSHGRVEFRLGSGSIEYEKIIHHVRIMLALVNRVKSTVAPTIQRKVRAQNPEFGPRWVFRVIGLAVSSWAPVVAPEADETRKWVAQRTKKFERPGASVAPEGED